MCSFHLGNQSETNMHISYDCGTQLVGTHPGNNSPTGPQGLQMRMFVEEFFVTVGIRR